MNKLQKITEEAKCFVNAKNIILHYPQHQVEENRVNLHYYHSEWESGNDRAENNLGDVLSEVVVKWMCSQKGIDFSKETADTRHLYAIGSILQMGYQDTTVWGSGFAMELGKLRSIPHSSDFKHLDVRCVRGPKTRKTLQKLGHDCPKVYGDPAVLMPLIYQPKQAEKSDYLIIPHYSQEKNARKKYGDKHILSMCTDDYESVIDKIAASKRVISSSLHGIILAEAYGVPAVFLMDRESRFNYKYEDWYLSTGRLDFPCVTSIKDGLKCNIPALDGKRIIRLQKNLLNSFPSELWK